MKNPEKEKFKTTLILTFLVALIALSMFMIIMSLELSPTIKLVEDLELLQSIYESARISLSSEIMILGHTLDGIQHYIDVYQADRFPGDFPIILHGEAAYSKTISGLSRNSKPHLEWIIRELNICYFALSNKSFGQLTVYDLRRVANLIRLSVEDAR